MTENNPSFPVESLRASELAREIRESESIARRIHSWVKARLGGVFTADPAIVIPEPLPTFDKGDDDDIFLQETAPVVAPESKEALLKDFEAWLDAHANDGNDRDNAQILNAFAQMFSHVSDLQATMSDQQRMTMPTREVISAMMWKVLPNHTGPYNSLVQQLARSGLMARLEKYVDQQLGRK